MKNKNDTKDLKIAIAINIVIFILLVASAIIMFTGFKFMHGPVINLESTKFGMLRFFTVQSNLFMGVVSLIIAIKQIQILRGKRSGLKTIDYIFKMMASSAVGLTFVVVFTYLGPFSKYGITAFLQNSNLFLHLIIPVLSIMNFVLFERTDKIKFRYTLFGIIPTVLYAIFYMTNIFIHMENGVVSTVYDWYYFVQNGVWTSVIVVPGMIFISYLITLAIWKLNKVKKG